MVRLVLTSQAQEVNHKQRPWCSLQSSGRDDVPSGPSHGPRYCVLLPGPSSLSIPWNSGAFGPGGQPGKVSTCLWDFLGVGRIEGRGLLVEIYLLGKCVYSRTITVVTVSVYQPPYASLLHTVSHFSRHCPPQSTCAAAETQHREGPRPTAWGGGGGRAGRRCQSPGPVLLSQHAAQEDLEGDGILQALASPVFLFIWF